MSEVQETESPPTKKPKLEVDCNNDAVPNDENKIDFTEDTIETDDKFTIYNNDKYTNFVTPDELQKLKEFTVLDEVNSDDGDVSNDDDSDDSEGEERKPAPDLPDEEIEKMLDENLPDELKVPPKPKEKPYVTRTKIVLEEKGVNQFEVLPLDWMIVRHYSGMPVYMHRPTRVCTLAKPYFLAKGNTRRHDIPISAIPCLAYRRALEEEEKQNKIDRLVEERIKNNTWQQNNVDLNPNKDKTTTNNENNTDEAVAEIKTDNENEITADPVNRKRKCPFSHLNKTDATTSAPTVSSLANSNVMIKEEVGSNGEKNETNKDGNVEKVDGKVNEAENKEEIETSSGGANVEPNTEASVTVNVETTTEANVEANAEVNVEANKEAEANVEANAEVNGEANAEATATADEAAGAADGEESEIAREVLARRPVVLPGGRVVPPPRVECVDSTWKTQHLNADQINDYCKALFKFKTVNFLQFNRWADRRKYTKARKALQYPKLPEGTKLITIPGTNNGQEGGKAAKRDWIMNMNGGSYLSEFHEFVCRVLHKQPTYKYKQLENAATPYQATVVIGGMAYGVGRGSSKRQAKYAAARASIQTLIPAMREGPGPGPDPADPAPAADPADPANPADPAARSRAEPDFSFFDYIGIEDPRIADFCAVTCEPSPHAILLTCLLRNFGIGEWHVKVETKKLEYQKMELTMRVGKHTATVVCKNKKTAKQRAAQAILQALHPHIKSWGSLLRLYGSRSVKSCKEKKLEEQQITLLQDKARRNEPNHAVLDKLRSEMHKLRERDAAVVPLGTLLLPDDVPPHSAAALNNVDL